MTSEVLTILLLLQIKHFLFDFVFQTKKHIESKGVYGNIFGIEHSVLHGVGTLFSLFWFISLPVAFIFSILDTMVHYHIDWLKCNFGTKDINDKKFWIYFGLDQLAHQITYLVIVLLVSY